MKSAGRGDQATEEIDENEGKGGKEEKDGSILETIDQEVQVAKFKCPYHACHTCAHYAKGQSRGGSGANLHKCHLCPKAFHVNCIPPGAR